MDTRAWWTTDPRVAELDMTEETYQAGMQAARGAYPGGSVVKNLPANAEGLRDEGSIPALGRYPGGGHSNPLQYSCLENPMDRGAW